MTTFKKDSLSIEIYDTRANMGAAAADSIAAYIRELHGRKSEINIVFSAAPSQNEFLAELKKKNLPWNNINAFHMDEYIGLDEDAPQRFGNFLKERIFDAVPFKSVNYLYEKEAAPEKICADYTALLEKYPVDIVLMGIGENGHIAFNDPHVAFFDDPEEVKVVSLDQMCRMQQVNDGCFASLDRVPTHAITLTIPAMLRADKIICVVPGPAKANAVKATVNGPITRDCPASILRRHRKEITLYCNTESAKYIL